MADDIDITPEAEFVRAVEDIFAGMHFCRPGIIRKFHPETNRVDVVPAIQSKVITDDREVVYRELPLLVEVPVVVPCSQRGGYCLTFPIRPGDECLLIFSDRSLDAFVERGGYSPPEEAGGNALYTNPRQHSLSDAICMPGIITRPNAVKNWNNDAIELRDAEREKRVTILESGIEVTDGRAQIGVGAGRVHVEAPHGFTVSAPNWRLDGDGRSWGAGAVRAADLETENGFSANSHRHREVEPGDGISGGFCY